MGFSSCCCCCRWLLQLQLQLLVKCAAIAAFNCGTLCFRGISSLAHPNAILCSCWFFSNAFSAAHKQQQQQQKLDIFDTPRSFSGANDYFLCVCVCVAQVEPIKRFGSDKWFITTYPLLFHIVDGADFTIATILRRHTIRITWTGGIRHGRGCCGCCRRCGRWSVSAADV